MSEYAVPRDFTARLPGSWPEPSTGLGPLEKVINTVELCEQILGYLPCADLNRARRVCRQFDAVISQSTIMQRRSSLRLSPNQIVWASPSNNTLLNGIYAEDYNAAGRAEGRATRQFPVHEMHPCLRVDHGTSYIGHRTGTNPDWMWCTGYHRFSFKDLCLTQIPDRFASDDVRICQPPTTRVWVSLYCTHFEEIIVDNDDGVTFGDVRRAVKEYLSDETNDPGPSFPWEPFKCTATITPRALDYFTRWTITSSPGRAYDCRYIFFDCAGILLMTALIISIRMTPVDYADVVTLCIALCVWVHTFFVSFPWEPSTTAQSPRLIEEPAECRYYLFLGGHDNVPVTAEERLTLEKIGVVTADNDPYHLNRLRLKAAA